MAAGLVFGLLALTSGPASVTAEPRTRVLLNGVPTPVFFNDGDSFRVLQGKYSGAKARLAGFNTLESYGPVHVWGGWHPKELYANAKMATLFARRGVWTCEADGDLDTYGRLLVWCPDLAEAQVRRGYAHAMSIDDDPAHPALVAAQQAAIEEKAGMWAHGVPAFILTSLHSAEEDISGKGTYNRLVSTEDGHSVMWKHDEQFAECERVCHQIYRVDDGRVDAAASVLASDPEGAAIVDGLSAAQIRELVAEFAAFGHVGRALPRDRRPALKALLARWADAGRLGERSPSEGACMIHVPFQRRFGEGRARCLR